MMRAFSLNSRRLGRAVTAAAAVLAAFAMKNVGIFYTLRSRAAGERSKPFKWI